MDDTFWKRHGRTIMKLIGDILRIGVTGASMKI